MEILARTQATDKTLAAYIDAPFAWGRRDCGRMVAMHLRHMGHRVSLVKAGEYSSAKGAVRALSRMGYESLEAALDAQFVRIAPAEAVVGDVIALPSDCALSALAVRLSNGRVLHSWQGGFSISEPLLFVAAWRVPCLKSVEVS